MFDLSTYLLAVQTIDFADPATFGVTVVLGAATMLAFHRLGRSQGEDAGYLDGFNDGLGAADTRASYFDGFNDGLDAADERGAYLDGFEDGVEER